VLSVITSTNNTVPPIKTIILFANFDGPEPQKYRVTEDVWESLELALQNLDDVQLERVEKSFKTSSEAIAEGEKRKATIVIWGWYGVTAQAVSLSVHFEVLRSPGYILEVGPEAKGLIRTMDVTELDSFALQIRLSEEMAYLCLFTVGAIHYMAQDWDKAIASFSGALSQSREPVPALDRGIVHLYRGIAYSIEGYYSKAIADFDRVIELQPDSAMGYVSRGNAYALKGDADYAISNYDRAIELQPNHTYIYLSRGSSYVLKRDYDRAIADYDRAIELQPDLAAIPFK